MAITQARDYYRVLQIDPDAEPEVVAAAYRRLAAKYHPDVNSTPEAAERMVEINVAYDVLGDPAKRAEYDRAHAWAKSAATGESRPQAPRSAVEGFARALVLMVISGIILNLIFGAFAGAGGRWMAVLVIVGLLIWKGGPIFRYFSGR